MGDNFMAPDGTNACMDAGGRAPKAGALGDAGAIIEE